jgi:hypothetical protein
MAYNAFISTVTQPMFTLAGALQSALHSFAKSTRLPKKSFGEGPRFAIDQALKLLAAKAKQRVPGDSRLLKETRQRQ